MAREPEADTERAKANRPGPEAPEGSEPERGRAQSLSPDEKRRVAREQGRLIASGEASKGHTVLRTPARRAIFIGGLLGIVVLAFIAVAFT